MGSGLEPVGLVGSKDSVDSGEELEMLEIFSNHYSEEPLVEVQVEEGTHSAVVVGNELGTLKEMT